MPSPSMLYRAYRDVFLKVLVKVRDLVVRGDEKYNLGGNMYMSVDNLLVDGTLIVSDQSLLRTWGSVVVTGKVIVQDNSQVISEVVS